MSGSVNIAAYSDALVVLGTAGVVVPMVRKLGINPVLGYLGAGAVLGPLGLGSFIHEVPPLYWLTVVDTANVSSIAELGIVFLLFLIGLELSFARLMTMRRLVFGLGFSQVVLTATMIAGVLWLLGEPTTAAVVVGACLALSSTAVVVELLSNQGRLNTVGGRAAFSVLLAQDLAVIPILLLVSVLAAKGEEATVLASLGSALAQAVLALLVIVVAGRSTLRPLFRLVASARSSELLIAAILFVIVGTGVLAALAGVSMALGAFVAGLLLAETEYRKAIQAIVEPFKSLLLGIFFFTVGMSIDLREVVRDPLVLLAAIAGLIGLKIVVLAVLARLFGLGWPSAAEVAMMLAPGGEFAFVGIGAALTVGVVNTATANFALTVASLSMALIPALISLSRRVERSLSPPAAIDPEMLRQPDIAVAGHTIVVGHGRVGRVVCALLAGHKRPYIAVDLDPLGVARDRRLGDEVFYGDATNPSFLASCGIADAAAVVITIDGPSIIDAVVVLVRSLRPDVPIFSRARDAAHARHLYAIGVTDAVPETIEASLQLSETALVGIGVPTGLVIASIHEKRDEFRADLMLAALRHGGETRAIKPKTSSRT